ncbi:MAG: SPFH domain-containing protein [Clostridia bacterium]|nr:SPFH domain-containing protein [Clostridia bacterium]
MKRTISVKGENLVWKEENIPNKTVLLTVNEGVDCYLYQNGSRIAKIAGDGLETKINNKLLNKKEYSVYCVNVRNTIRVNFGTSTPATFIDKDLNFQLQARARGFVNISINDLSFLINKLQNQDVIENEEIVKIVQPIIIKQCTSKLQQLCNGKSKSEVLALEKELSKKIVIDSSREITESTGIYINNAVIEGITVTGDEEFRKNETDLALSKQHVELEKNSSEIKKLQADGLKATLSAFGVNEDKNQEKEVTCSFCKKTVKINDSIKFCPSYGRLIKK